jgi:hypothetical protein
MALHETIEGGTSSSVLSRTSGQALGPLLEPILYLVTACERCMGGNLTELGLLMGIPLELVRGDIMEIAEDFNDTDREVRIFQLKKNHAMTLIIHVLVDYLHCSLLWGGVVAHFVECLHVYGPPSI